MNTQGTPARSSPRILYSLSADPPESAQDPQPSGITASAYRAELKRVERTYSFPYAKGRVNPYTGIPVETEADYRAYISCLAMRRTASRAIDSSSAVSHHAQGVAEEARRVAAAHLAEAKKEKERAEVFHRELVALEAKVEQKRRTEKKVLIALIVPLVLFCLLSLCLINASGNTESNSQSTAAESPAENPPAEQPTHEEGANPSKANTGSGAKRPSGYESDTYIGNKNSHKFHKSSCSHLPDKKNQRKFKTREEAISAGFTPCGICGP